MAKPMFGTWQPGDPELLDVPVESESRDCGGTAHFLPSERKRATFDVLKMTHVIDGGAKATKRRRWIWSEGQAFDNSRNYYLTREKLVAQHNKRFIETHKKFTGKFIPSVRDIMLMTNATRNGGAFGLHFGAFMPTIMSQCTSKQQMEWLLPAMNMKIFGALAQTELGHGSNVRALQTTATYIKDTEEFLINSPTLKALKWWPGGLGKTATHCILYAQLIVDGKEYGFHSFMFQLRDEHHLPLPGIEVGEVGPKIGDNFTETGFLRITNVRIPRTWMLMKNQQVTPDGKYVKKEKKGGGKSQYSTMLSIRAALVMGAGYRLAQGVTIIARYSCVRSQGFVNPEKATNRLAAENVILDYQVQQFRVLKQLAIAYAFVFTGKYIQQKFESVGVLTGESAGEEAIRELGVLHAMSAGLKALCTFSAADGLEECRKCCGGHGVLLVSGVAQMTVDYLTYCTAEGDRIILELQTAKFLMKSFASARAGEQLATICDYLRPVSDKQFSISKIPVCNAKTIQDFCDLDQLIQLFRYRALRSIVRASSRYTKKLQEVEGVQAWNACAVDMVDASRAHCYYVILRSFVLEVGQVKDLQVKTALSRLCALFGTIHMQDNLGDWMGHMTPETVTALRDTVRHLLQIVRPNAIALTDAFEFPDCVLNSALGRHDGKVYEALYEAARTSPLNETDPFEGYKYLKDVLDVNFIRKHAKMVKSGPIQLKPKL